MTDKKIKMKVFDEEIENKKKHELTSKKINVSLLNDDVRNLIREILNNSNSSVLYELVERNLFTQLLCDIQNVSLLKEDNTLLITNGKISYLIEKLNNQYDIAEGNIIENKFIPRAFIRVTEESLKNYNSKIIVIVSETKHFNLNNEREKSKYYAKIIFKTVNGKQIFLTQDYYSNEEFNADVENFRTDMDNTYIMKGKNGTLLD